MNMINENDWTHLLCYDGPLMCYGDDGAPVLRRLTNENGEHSYCLYWIASHALAIEHFEGDHQNLKCHSFISCTGTRYAVVTRIHQVLHCFDYLRTIGRVV